MSTLVEPKIKTMVRIILMYHARSKAPSMPTLPLDHGIRYFAEEYPSSVNQYIKEHLDIDLT